MSRRNRIALGLVVSLAVLYAAICGFMYFAQDSLLFYPTSTDAAVVDALVKDEGASRLEVQRDDGSSRGVFLPGEGDGARPTVIYFGGNGEAVLNKAAGMKSLRERGWNVVMMSYRGYDASDGTPGAAAFLADSLAVYDAVSSIPTVRAEAIVPWGTSLGSGVAAYLSTHRPVAGTILFAPYSRLSAIAGDQYPWLPVDALFKHAIDTIDWVPSARSGAIIVHGDQDEVIPLGHGRAVAAAWPGARLAVMPGAPHNGLWDLPDAKDAVHTYLEDLTALPAASASSGPMPGPRG